MRLHAPRAEFRKFLYQDIGEAMPTPEGINRLQANLDRLRETIASACRTADRDPADVRLVAVTKYASLDAVRALLAAGVFDLGENYVQQLVQRAQELGSADGGLTEETPEQPRRPRWHMIGHLQRNKVKPLLKYVRILHSLDSVRLAEELEKQAARNEEMIDVFLEINMAGENSKSGAPPADADVIAEAATRAVHLRLRGLMTMAPYDLEPETVRPYFASLRELLENLRRKGTVGPECVHLSMGMTNDYAVAIEEGATIIRVGSALFEGVEEHSTSG